MIKSFDGYKPELWIHQSNTELLPDGIPVIKRSPILSLFSIIRILIRLNSYIKKNKTQGQDTIIFIPAFHYLNYFIARLARKLKAKCFVSVHDYSTHLGEQSKWIEFMQKETIRMCTKAIFLSNHELQKAINDELPEDKLFLLPHPIIPARQKHQLAHSEQVRILFFGRIRTYKGLRMLTEALLTIPFEECTIAGQGHIGGLNKLGSKYNIINKEVSEDKLEELFCNHHFIVLPYMEASQSGVLAKAIGFEIPVVLTRVGGLKEQINEQSAVFCGANTEELHSALLRLTQDKTRYNQLKQNLKDWKTTYGDEWKASFRDLIHLMALNSEAT